MRLRSSDTANRAFHMQIEKLTSVGSSARSSHLVLSLRDNLIELYLPLVKQLAGRDRTRHELAEEVLRYARRLEEEHDDHLDAAADVGRFAVHALSPTVAFEKDVLDRLIGLLDEETDQQEIEMLRRYIRWDLT